MNDYSVLSLDQATNCGFALGKGGKILERGVIISDKDGFDFIISDIKQQVVSLISKYNPVLVTIEEVHYNPLTGSTVFGKLKKMQGVLINHFIENEILYEIIKPSQWQGKQGEYFVGKEKKKQSLAKAIELFNDKNMNENTADAIWMCRYAMKNIKIEQKC